MCSYGVRTFFASQMTLSILSSYSEVGSPSISEMTCVSQHDKSGKPAMPGLAEVFIAHHSPLHNTTPDLPESDVWILHATMPALRPKMLLPVEACAGTGLANAHVGRAAGHSSPALSPKASCAKECHMLRTLLRHGHAIVQHARRALQA